MICRDFFKLALSMFVGAGKEKTNHIQHQGDKSSLGLQQELRQEQCFDEDDPCRKMYHFCLGAPLL